MTVFEDLIVELKEENLLEETVISVDKLTASAVFTNGSEEHDFADLIDDDAPSFDEAPAETGAAIVTGDIEKERARSSSSLQQFASEQIATNQMVEHILASIEQSRFKASESGFDELEAKKALHMFQQASADPSSMEYAEAEAELSAQVSSWQKTLAGRDAELSVEVLRRFCETCQPALSAQALFSLARFYRRLPYSELARGKFEFIVTRLFSKKAEGEKRALICHKDEVLGHLRSRFKDSADSYLSIPGDDEDVKVIVRTFDDFMAEAESATSFKELVDSYFFNRLYTFKESTRKSFFSPSVVAAAIASNLTIGNKLVGLFETERAAGNSARLIEQYSSTQDEDMSRAVGRSLDLVTLLKRDAAEESDDAIAVPVKDERMDRELVETRREPAVKATVPKKNKQAGSSSWLAFRIGGVNKWLLAATIFITIASVGLYVWANYYGDSIPVSKDVKTIDMTNTPFKDLVREARVSSETFYGITLPAWDTLPKESQEQTVQNLLKSGVDKGYKRVSLINPKGQTVGFAMEGRVEIMRP